MGEMQLDTGIVWFFSHTGTYIYWQRQEQNTQSIQSKRLLWLQTNDMNKHRNSYAVDIRQRRSVAPIRLAILRFHCKVLLQYHVSLLLSQSKNETNPKNLTFEICFCVYIQPKCDTIMLLMFEEDDFWRSRTSLPRARVTTFVNG
jgi:hypothetical protein